MYTAPLITDLIKRTGTTCYRQKCYCERNLEQGNKILTVQKSVSSSQTLEVERKSIVPHGSFYWSVKITDVHIPNNWRIFMAPLKRHCISCYHDYGQELALSLLYYLEIERKHFLK